MCKNKQYLPAAIYNYVLGSNALKFQFQAGPSFPPLSYNQSNFKNLLWKMFRESTSTMQPSQLKELLKKMFSFKRLIGRLQKKSFRKTRQQIQITTILTAVNHLLLEQRGIHYPCKHSVLIGLLLPAAFKATVLLHKLETTLLMLRVFATTKLHPKCQFAFLKFPAH